jgi:single-stranded DNA-binding protein
VLVIGRLEISEWQTREDETRTSYDICREPVTAQGWILRPG